MNVGAGLLTCQRREDDDRSVEELYDQAITYASAAEDAGLASVWVSEHHFSDDGYMPGVMPTLGAIANATESVEIGTCLALAPFWDPIRLAEDAATVSALSGGRMTLGLGGGYVDQEFERFGVDPAERGERVADAVAVCRGAWSDGPIEVDSPFHPAPPDTVVTPTPTTEPDVVLGGTSQPAVRRAARLADGWCGTSALSIDDLGVRTEDIEGVRRDEDLDGEFTNYVLVHGFVGDSADEAWETVREGFVHTHEQYGKFYAGEPVELSAEKLQELKDDAIFGAPAEVAEQLAAYEDALGEDGQVIFRTYQPGLATEDLLRCLELLGDEVVPAL